MAWERADTRIIASVGVIATINGEAVPCMTMDLSRGGMALLTDKTAPVGTKIELKIVHQGTRLRALAEVVTVKERGMSVRYVDASDAFRAAIGELMKGLYAAHQAPSGTEPSPPAQPLEAVASWTVDPNRRRFGLLPAKQYEASVADLTLQGAALRSKQKPEVGAEIYVHLAERGNNTDAATTKCTVVRHTPQGFAVSFDSPPIEFRRLVSRLRRGKFAKGSKPAPRNP